MIRLLVLAVALIMLGLMYRRRQPVPPSRDEYYRFCTSRAYPETTTFDPYVMDFLRGRAH